MLLESLDHLSGFTVLGTESGREPESAAGADRLPESVGAPSGDAARRVRRRCALVFRLRCLGTVGVNGSPMELSVTPAAGGAAPSAVAGVSALATTAGSASFNAITLGASVG